MTPYYEDANTTIYHGDCLEVLPTLKNVDLFITSPPYNMGSSPWPHLGHWKPGDSAGGKSKWRNGSDGSGGVTYVEHEDKMPWDQYVGWQQMVIEAMDDALAPAGAIFYNHKPRVIGGRLWTPLELIPADVGVELRQIVTWDRGGGMNFNPTAFVPQYEWIIVLARVAWRLKSKGVSGLGDVWRIHATPNPDHPAPFPLGLPARAIEATGPGLVVDPFMGSGTTLRAAMDAGVRSIGIERSERYCEVAAQRLSQGVLAL